ncbi:CHAD domain-containing protein [Lysobacter enzymogenes]|uniref:CHAD domain-containing protein n=1 Tax=Lysobacter enzymogenes TaxID=69 RepID=UPI001A959CF2|nr:CHAD domain-containing protein [Lysobacter enzymogenes]QQP95077.1 CHAD domain-containing protein [Lysobacter enzymogenes]
MPQAAVEADAEGVESAAQPGARRAAGAARRPRSRGGSAPPSPPARAEPLPVVDESEPEPAPRPPGQRLRAHATREIDQALDALGWGGNRLHAGVHLARKCLRRARATLALGGDALGPGRDWVDRAIRDLNRDLSSLRDAHALVETLDRLLRGTLAPEARPLLARARRAAAAARAQAAHAARADDPGLGRRRALLRVLRAALRALPWKQLQPEHWRGAVAAGLARVERAGERARASGGDEDWHEWRRRARRLSQQQRALKSAGLGADAPTFDKHQIERLGEAQDLTLLLEHCGKGSPFAKLERGAVKAFARAELERARERIQG